MAMFSVWIIVGVLLNFGSVILETTGVAKGGDCTSDACDNGLTCESNVCKIKAGATCAADADCITGATCPSADDKCVCGDTMVPKADNTKCLKYVGGQCTAATDCANSDNTDCTGNKCTCKPNYTGDENSACKLKLEQECINADDCYGKNAECKDGTPKKCMCKTGYSADGQYCVSESSGSAVFGSVLLLLVAFMTSRLL